MSSSGRIGPSRGSGSDASGEMGSSTFGVESEQIDAAVAVLRKGGLVAFATETVYGLGADASNPDALAKVFAVKGRPADHPLIVHLASAAMVDEWAIDVPPVARALVTACWPGPLTILVRAAPHVSRVATGGRDTVGLRVPGHPVALRLLAAFGGGIAAPSANRFGRTSPTTAEHVHHDLGDDVDLILDGGPCPVGIESTIVDCTVEAPQILRSGGVAAEHVERIIGEHLGPGTTLGAPSGPARAPGMLAAHYAPRCQVLVVESIEEAASVGATLRLATPYPRIEILSCPGSVEDYARELYGALRDADRREVDVLVAVLPPPGGLGDAVRDRLQRAATGTDPSIRGDVT